MKKCTKCGEIKALSEFNKRASLLDGHMSACKKCRAKYYAANPEKYKAKAEKWRKDNPEKYLSNCKKRSLLNVEKEKIRHKTRYAANPEKYKAEAEKWRKDNPEKYRKSMSSQIEKGNRGYIAHTLGVKSSQLTPELLELKRAQLEMYRLTKQLNKEIQNGTK